MTTRANHDNDMLGDVDFSQGCAASQAVQHTTRIKALSNMQQKVVTQMIGVALTQASAR